MDPTVRIMLTTSRSVDLPEPEGPMIAFTSAAANVVVTPERISFPVASPGAGGTR